MLIYVYFKNKIRPEAKTISTIYSWISIHLLLKVFNTYSDDDFLYHYIIGEFDYIHKRQVFCPQNMRLTKLLVWNYTPSPIQRWARVPVLISMVSYCFSWTPFICVELYGQMKE